MVNKTVRIIKSPILPQLILYGAYAANVSGKWQATVTSQAGAWWGIKFCTRVSEAPSQVLRVLSG